MTASARTYPVLSSDFRILTYSPIRLTGTALSSAVNVPVTAASGSYEAYTTASLPTGAAETSVSSLATLSASSSKQSASVGTYPVRLPDVILVHPLSCSITSAILYSKSLPATSESSSGSCITAR